MLQKNDDHNAYRLPTSLRLKGETNELWELVSQNLGISKTAVIDMLLHEKAAKMGLLKSGIPLEAGKTLVEVPPGAGKTLSMSLGLGVAASKHSNSANALRKQEACGALQEAYFNFVTATEDLMDKDSTYSAVQFMNVVARMINLLNVSEPLKQGAEGSMSTTNYDDTIIAKAEYQAVSATPKRGRGRPKNIKQDGEAVMAATGQSGQGQMEKVAVK